MGKIQRPANANRRQGRRRWRFASAEFDEGTWILTVDGRPAQVEGKPLELLHELLLRAGELVTKDELLEAVWPDVSVVEASLPTAVLKLRRALGDDGGGATIIETVPRIGYRLAAAVEVEVVAPRTPAVSAVLDPEAAQVHRRAAETGRQMSWLLAAAGLAVALLGGATLTAWATHNPPRFVRAYSQQDAREAIRKLDVVKVEAMLHAGWNPNTAFDSDGNGALNILLNMCEWNPGHDRQKMLLMARTLTEGGARLDTYNVWGDTPYSIAKAPRYCGPDHPVTVMLRNECYNGFRPLGDRCLAAYPPKQRVE